MGGCLCTPVQTFLCVGLCDDGVTGPPRATAGNRQKRNHYGRVPRFPWERVRNEASVLRLPRQPPMTRRLRIGHQAAKRRKLRSRGGEPGRKRGRRTTAATTNRRKKRETATRTSEEDPSGLEAAEPEPRGTAPDRKQGRPAQTDERTSTEPATTLEGRGSTRAGRGPVKQYSTLATSGYRNPRVGLRGRADRSGDGLKLHARRRGPHRNTKRQVARGALIREARPASVPRGTFSVPHMFEVRCCHPEARTASASCKRN
ncbi:hypothetical protein NDU88_007560 [Pleurodeles waltl]|uniref:Uncharacterized protein n=1 Tax=Pleurodeles waltl TaxID=8319 RepID=A0AAV7QMG0_PLEWA|nr:hypothetical protein NDU88_007560 [Pleurodeles waltl]